MPSPGIPGTLSSQRCRSLNLPTFGMHIDTGPIVAAKHPKPTFVNLGRWLHGFPVSWPRFMRPQQNSHGHRPISRFFFGPQETSQRFCWKQAPRPHLHKILVVFLTNISQLVVALRWPQCKSQSSRRDVVRQGNGVGS